MLHIDFETRSYLELSGKDSVGVYNYCISDRTEWLMLAWAIGNGDVNVWFPDEVMPPELKTALDDSTVEITAFNSTFERYILKFKLGIEIPVERFQDSQPSGRYLSLPASLDDQGEVLGLPQNLRKNKRGKELIEIFSKPSKRKKKRGEPDVFYFKDKMTNPDEWKQFVEYCRQDVVAEREIGRRQALLGAFPLPPVEREIWILDQKINDRGIPADRTFATNGFEMAEEDKNKQKEALNILTGLENANSRDRMLAWMQTQGYTENTLRKGTVESFLKYNEDKLTPIGSKALRMREAASSTSYKKMAAILRQLNPDDRLRNQFIFMGSPACGRWCLAEGSPVKVKSKGLVFDKPIESVTKDDLLWDGVQWVTHDGVIESGDKDVITWDQVKATSEHDVWISENSKMKLGEAKKKEIKLWNPEVYSIYRITSPSGNYYIGMSKYSVKVRFRNHIRKATKGLSNGPFYRAIRKYGKESFKLETIDFAPDKKAAQALERFYIASAPKGNLYNLSSGGEADGEDGSKIFWDSINADPEKRAEYLKKLSDIKINNDWSDYAKLTQQNLEWRKQNPREAYRLAYRGVRLANKALGHTPEKDTRSLRERLLWKHRRGVILKEHVTRIWSERTPEQVEEIANKIGEKAILRWELITDPQVRSAKTSAARAAIDRVKQGKAASVGLKKYWADRKAREAKEKDENL